MDDYITAKSNVLQQVPKQLQRSSILRQPNTNLSRLLVGTRVLPGFASNDRRRCALPPCAPTKTVLCNAAPQPLATFYPKPNKIRH